MIRERFHPRPEEIYARHPRRRLVNAQFPGKQAGYDTDWPLPLKVSVLDYMQIVLNYGEGRFFKVRGDVLCYALEMWSNEGEKMAPVWLPVRRMRGRNMLFAAHTPRFQDDAIVALDAACYAPLPELNLDPAHLKWIRTFPQPLCRTGRGYGMDSPGGSSRIPKWLVAEGGGWAIKGK